MWQPGGPALGVGAPGLELCLCLLPQWQFSALRRPFLIHPTGSCAVPCRPEPPSPAGHHSSIPFRRPRGQVALGWAWGPQLMPRPLPGGPGLACLGQRSKLGHRYTVLGTQGLIPPFLPHPVLPAPAFSRHSRMRGGDPRCLGSSWSIDRTGSFWKFLCRVGGACSILLCLGLPGTAC